MFISAYRSRGKARASTSLPIELAENCGRLTGVDKSYQRGLFDAGHPTEDCERRFGVAHRSAGSLSWAGLANTWFWVDPSRVIAGLFLTQLVPFADTRVLTAYDAYEQAVYAAIH